MTINQIMTKLDQTMASLNNKVAEKQKYEECNKTLFIKTIPYITKEEAQKAYKLLVKKFAKKKVWSNFHNKWVTKKCRGNGYYSKHPRKCWICLSGNSNELAKGWRRLIHDVSHMVHKFLRPTFSDHCFQQAELELDMIKYVVAQGWLDGKLKVNKITLTVEQKRSIKKSHLIDLIKRWEAKQKKAHTYLKKYKQRLKRIA
jgi:hypothetical protein